MKNAQLRLLALVLAALMLVSGCGSAPGGFRGKVEGVSFDLPALGDGVALHTQEQAECLAQIEKSGNADDCLGFAQGIWEHSRPEPVKLTWTAQGEGIDGYTVRLSRQPDMSEPFFTADTAKPELKVYNLEAGATYYWTITARMGDKTATAGPASFATQGSLPRNLHIDGVTNARDMGGWPTEDGGFVRQGLLYRCGRLNTSNIQELQVEITEEGITMLRDVLGVRLELDLREDAEAVQLQESPLGSQVAYHRIPMVWDGNILQDNPEALRRIFALLADEASYPMILHCNIGTDRTGLVCFLVGALLGVSQEDLCLDYVFSNFGKIKGTRSADTILQAYLPLINAMPGATLQARTYAYLLQLGIPAQQLDGVIAILKGQ